MKFIKQFLIAAAAILILDILWLGIIAKEFYLTKLQGIATIENGSIVFNYLPAIGFYLIATGALVYFTQKESSYKSTLTKGAYLGFAMYATYDLTNLAIISTFSQTMAIVDILWGTCLMGITAIFTKYLSEKLK